MNNGYVIYDPDSDNPPDCWCGRKQNRRNWSGFLSNVIPFESKQEAQEYYDDSGTWRNFPHSVILTVEEAYAIAEMERL